ncbi:hypothetical protein G3I38_23360 [Streptomyces sp. SID7958]|uniref:Uncharacterized protein n=2 Tax=unclassified Streptomyces TaxID=2593676 RepID=A0A6G3QN37_9ACTN|nr:MULTISPECIES: hypothetical protein [unclassified Streptomyces]NEA84791.1 hypothetical protein [Streptomyces sp. SID14436]NEC82098.1 hypothetical protein [Streptomyces sp. SID7958]
MSGDKNRPDPYQQEREEATTQNGALDAVMTMTRVVNPFNPLNPFPGTRGIHFASTNFEGYDLNDMVDIVESANPELLESAGEALLAARTAIEEAAEVLDGDIKKIDWEGEAHDSFQKWAKSLVTTAKGLATYAETVGTQVMAAGSGLASVRKSMPPRDSRTNPKTVDDIPVVQRIDTNEEFTAARKAEQDRQEAINQMYRLASFYTVSQGMMAKAEEPVFPKMPDVGIPAPPPSYVPVPPGAARETPMLGEVGTTPQGATATGATAAGSVAEPTLVKGASEPSTLPKPPVGTEINSVGTLPPQEAVRPSTGAAPPVTGGPAGQPGPVPPMAPNTMPPAVRGATGRVTGPGAVPASRIPPAAQGRIGGPGAQGPIGRVGPGVTNTGPGTGSAGPMGRATGPMGPMGRAAVPGQGAGSGNGPVGPIGRATGPVGPMGRAGVPGQGAGPGNSPVGRGIVGGVPRAAAPLPGPVGGVPRGASGPLGAAPAGRGGAPGRSGDGVVGGRPVVGASPGTGASRLPRSTVIGGERGATSGTSGQRPGRQGVIGAPEATANSGRTPRRPVAGPDGVVGTPMGRGSASRKSERSSEASTGQRGTSGDRTSAPGRERRRKRRDDASASD